MIVDKLNTLFESLRTTKARRVLSFLAFASLLIYLLIGISAYAMWFPGSTRYFAYSNIVGILIRFFSTGLLFFVSLLVYISYYKEIDRKWLLVFIAIIFFSFLSMLYSDYSYTTYYLTHRLYDFMAEYHVSVSLTEVLLMQLSFAIDVAFGYCLMFVLPKCLNKKHLIIIFNVFLLIVFYSCIYSFLKEKAYYVKFLSGNWSYTNSTVGSIFGNKQQWGIFLISAFPICFLDIYLVIKSIKNKFIKLSVIAFNSITGLLTFVFGGVSFCKTEIVSSCLFIAIFVLGLIIITLVNRRTRKVGIALSVLCACFAIGIVFAIFKVPTLRKVLDNVLSTFESRSEESVAIRFTLVRGVFQNYPLYNLFFGMPKALTDPFVRALMPEIVNGLHTGIAIYFARTGLFGLLVFTILNLMLLKKYITNFRRKPFYCVILIGTYFVSIILNLSEADILIFSSSMVGYMLNLSLITLPFVYDEKEEKRNEKIFIVNC